MTALVHLNRHNSITQQIQFSAGWMGRVSGLKADKVLRGKKTPYLYVLREGENEFDYYVSFIQADFTIKHQPFTISETFETWSYENTVNGGPYVNATIEDVIHLIMHCGKDDCTPLIHFE